MSLPASARMFLSEPYVTSFNTQSTCKVSKPKRLAMFLSLPVKARLEGKVPFCMARDASVVEQASGGGGEGKGESKIKNVSDES